MMGGLGGSPVAGGERCAWGRKRGDFEPEEVLFRAMRRPNRRRGRTVERVCRPVGWVAGGVETP